MLKLAERRQAALTVPAAPIESPAAPAAQPETLTVAAALANHLAELGIERAFGVSGGAIALLFDAFQESTIEIGHFRHETGAAFAAAEAHFATGQPTVVFSTTGPGLLNALTGMTAARWDGAKVILISGATNAPQRGRWATQESSPYTLPQDGLYTAGPIFDYAIRVESAAELPEVFRRLALGIRQPGGFVAHISMPMSVQSQRIDRPRSISTLSVAAPAAAPSDVAHCARLLQQGGFAIWAGFGATRAAPLVRRLAERSGAPVFCSPRAKGVMPENHPSYLGVSGIGGHQTVTDHMLSQRPGWVLVLGSRLGEATSFWDRDLLPTKGFIHVDLDPDVPGTAFPDVETMGIQSDIGHFLSALVEHFPAKPRRGSGQTRPWDQPIPLRRPGRLPVRPRVLMDTIQRHVINKSDAVVLAECGNSFAWCNHHLRFDAPGRYRVSTLFGSMGHAATGVVGAALGRGGKAVAVLGDGSMLMNCELSTAAQYGVQAVWVVLNDAGYGMCRDGHRALGLTGENIGFPRADFVAVAKALGAGGATVETEDELEDAMRRAMAAAGPFVVDVRIDTSEPSPLLERFESLIKQGNSKNVAGWER